MSEGGLPEVDWPVDRQDSLRHGADLLGALYERVDSDLESLRAKLLTAVGILQLVTVVLTKDTVGEIPTWYLAYIVLFAVVGAVAALPALMPNRYPRPFDPGWLYQDAREYSPGQLSQQVIRYYVHACEVADRVNARYSLYLHASLGCSISAAVAAVASSINNEVVGLAIGLVGPLMYGLGWVLNNALTVSEGD